VAAGPLPELNNIDYVLHLAAPVSVQESLEDWEKYYRGIKIGSERVFEWAKNRGCHSIVAASTAAVYGDNEEVPFDETTIPDPMSPYAEYKLEMETVLDEYHNSTTQCAALRFFNVFGEGQPNDVGYVSAIPIFKKQFEAYQPITVTGDGQQTRDFVYVGDVVDACFTALTRPNGGFESMPIWNVASGEETQILDIAESFGGEIVHIEAREEPKRSLADISLITQMLDWRPTTKVLTWIKEQKDA
jgi:nucleoside-diphosphate-sugar epimerase